MYYLCRVHVLSQGVDGTRCEADPSRPCCKQLGHSIVPVHFHT